MMKKRSSSMYSKIGNTEIMINDEADEVIKDFFDSLKSRCQNNLDFEI